MGAVCVSIDRRGRAIAGEVWAKRFSDQSLSYCSLAVLTGPCIAQECPQANTTVSRNR
jgi:hypothetical protein